MFRHALGSIVVLVVGASALAHAQSDFWTRVAAPYNGDVRSLSFTPFGAMIAGTYGGGAWRSTNEGQSWSMIQSGMTSYYVLAVATAPNGSLYAGTISGVFRSTTNGNEWETLPITAPEVFSVAVAPSGPWVGTVFVGSIQGITRSTDAGATWSNFQLNGSVPIRAIVIDPSGNVYASGGSGGIYKSVDNGSTWFQTSVTTGGYSCLASNAGGHIFAGTSNGILRTTNGGASWEAVTIATGTVRSLAITPSGHVWAAVFFAGAYRSTDNGVTWTQLNSGLLSTNAVLINISPTGHAFLISAANMYRSTSAVTSVEVGTNERPDRFFLEQNFPNPFNPSTKIEFRVPSSEFVELTVLDLLGRKVASLVNEVKEPGRYEVTWDASEMPSGVYLCRLQTGSLVATRKLTLLR